MMMSKILDSQIRFAGVKGVGTMQVDFDVNQRVYTLIGENGVGKTKLLESLFAVLFLSHKQAIKQFQIIKKELFPFDFLTVNKLSFFDADNAVLGSRDLEAFTKAYQHKSPVVYLSAQQRGTIAHQQMSNAQIGDRRQRQHEYIGNILSLFKDVYPNKTLKTLNMDTPIETWIIQRAQSANPYQTKEDNREIEITVLLQLLNQIDERIDSQFLEISGDNRVFIKIEGQKRELSVLSSGFASILKMLQAIIAGYSYFTNEVQITHVRGVVLIDEIESHLHSAWQVKIIPLLKQLFPNTIFIVTTHSSLVISQLSQGEAYRLQRDKTDGVVYGKCIDYPRNTTLVDLLNTAFDINLNASKLGKVSKNNQMQAKSALLDLIQQEIHSLEAK